MVVADKVPEVPVKEILVPYPEPSVLEISKFVGAASSTVEMRLIPLTVNDFGEDGFEAEAAKAVSAPLERVNAGTAVVVPAKLRLPIVMAVLEELLALFLQTTILRIILESDFMDLDPKANVNFAALPVLLVKTVPVGDVFATVPVADVLTVGASNP